MRAGIYYFFSQKNKAIYLLAKIINLKVRFPYSINYNGWRTIYNLSLLIMNFFLFTSDIFRKFKLLHTPLLTSSTSDFFMKYHSLIILKNFDYPSQILLPLLIYSVRNASKSLLVFEWVVKE